jgi:hypothetical protein
MTGAGDQEKKVVLEDLKDRAGVIAKRERREGRVRVGERDDSGRRKLCLRKSCDV